MKKNITQILFIFFFAIIFIGCSSEKKSPPEIEKGVFNLSDWDFEKDGAAKLDGEWEYYPNQILSPAEIQSYKDSIRYKQVPELWNESMFKTSFGCATYRLVINLNENHEKELAFKVFTFATNGYIFVNGDLVSKSGVVGTSPETSVPEYKPQVSDFYVDGNRLEIVLQVSNFYHKKGGTWQTIKMGTEDEMLKDRERAVMFDLFLLGSILIMSFYHFGLYLLRKKDIYTLFFALLTLFVAFRIGSTGEYLLGNIKWVHFGLLMRVEYISFYLAAASFMLFLRSLFPNEINKKITGILVLTTLIFILISAFFKAHIFSQFVLYYQAFILVFAVIYYLITLSISVKRKREGAGIFLIGFFILAITVVNDILYNNEIIHTGNLFQTGIFLFLFSQAYLISLRFSKSFIRTEELSEKLDYQNKNLESIVEKRTYEIREKNVVLGQQKEEIMAQKEELQTINDELQSMNVELEKLSVVASKTDNSVTIADKDGNILWVNSGFERMFGYNFEDFKEKIGTNLIKTSSNSKITEIVNKSISKKQSATYTSKNITENNTELWIQTTLTPIFDNKGELINLIAIDSDITKIIVAEQKIEEQNEHIKSSIRYAKTIQNAILPSLEFINTVFETFIIFKPKDIVSGDFYWLTHFTEKKSEQLTEKIMIAAVDCTGHGVPGAFMSLIGNRMLSELVNEKNIISPAQILEELDLMIRKVLKQDETDNRDGMDMALCKIEKDFDGTRTITFAGAKRPLFYFDGSKKEIINIKGTRRSVGGFKTPYTKISFENNIINLQVGDII